MNFDDIVSLYEERKKTSGVVMQRMREVRDAYNGDIIIPLPEMDQGERPFVVNQINSGIDSYGRRIGSTLPNLECPPTKPGEDRPEKYARIRRRALLGIWEENHLPRLLPQRGRYLLAYSTSPVVVRWDTRAKMPRFHVINPLSAYPGPSPAWDPLNPVDFIHAYNQPLRELVRTYGAPKISLLNLGSNPSGDDRLEVVEYIDDEEIVLGVIGKPKTDYYDDSGKLPFIELARAQHKGERCLAVVPGRITLDRPIGQFDSVIGMQYQQAKLMALEVIAVEKGVFPDMAIVARTPGEVPKVLNGQWKDGRSGEINLVQGNIEVVQQNPGYKTDIMIDRLERNARVDAGVTPEMGGEASSNIRTGRRGDAVQAASVDMVVGEAQNILAEALVEENRRAIALLKNRDGGSSRTFYVNWKGAKGRVDFIPAKHFDTDHTVVAYPMPGTDANGLAVSGGQRVASETMSKRRFMELDPLVDDVELEHDRIVAEALERALLASVASQAAEGAIPPADIARIAQLVMSDKMELAEAILQAQKEAQERQATSGPPGTPEAPAEPGSPEAQPGLGVGPEGQAVPSIPEPASAVSNLTSIFSNLRMPQMTVASERQAG